MSQHAPNPEPLTRAAVVTLRDVTAATVLDICRLAVAPEQTRYVASNALSIAEAHFTPEAWFRAVYADETPVGFAMLYKDTGTFVYDLWRLMIDARYQGLGYGKQALLLIVAHVRMLPGATSLRLSYVPGDHAPAAFYRKLGFTETGVQDGDELEMRLAFLAPDLKRG